MSENIAVLAPMATAMVPMAARFPPPHRDLLSPRTQPADLDPGGCPANHPGERLMPEAGAACSGMAPQVRIAWRELHRPRRIGNPNV